MDAFEQEQQEHRDFCVLLLEEAVSYDKAARNPDAALEKLCRIAEIRHPGDSEAQENYLAGRASEFEEQDKLKRDTAALLVAIVIRGYLAKEKIDV